MGWATESESLCQEQEFYLLGLVHCGVHDVEELFVRWSTLYPVHRSGGREQFDRLVRLIVVKAKVLAQSEGDRVSKILPVNVQ